MSDPPIRPERRGTPPSIKPYLQRFDRMQQREALRPDQITDRAGALLVERCGASSQSTEAAFAHGPVGLLNGHTHYFNGFSVLMPLLHGTAVAVRRAGDSVSRLTFEGSDELWSFDRTVPAPDAARRDRPVWACVVAEVVRYFGLDDTQVEVAVVSTIQAGCREAYLAALGVATARALQALFALPNSTTDLLEDLRRIISECVELPFSIACLIAAEAGRPQAFTLVDTDTHEQMPVEAPTRELLGWGVVDVGSGQLHTDASYWEYKEKADKALIQLQNKGFEHLTSFRELEHRDLQHALEVLPRRLRPVARHLVTENRRVQKLVVAMRRRDWQMLGALLLMSHASLRDDWRHTSEEVDFVVDQAMSIEGMYGATVTGRGGCVLVVGKPFVMPLCLDRIQTSFEARFQRVPESLML
ncbi:MAG: hypothetical protein ACE5G0_05005 [Rhodothermales bacterium]